MQTREERDTMGVVEVPAEALWGAQTQRSLQLVGWGEERTPTSQNRNTLRLLSIRRLKPPALAGQL